MNEKLKSQKGFVAVTLITLLAIALVLMVYASLLATFRGGEVTVGNVTGNVGYSETNLASSTWEKNLYNVSGSWYARTNYTSAYTGDVIITWQLEHGEGGWHNETGATVITTSYTLNGNGSQPAYATIDGLITGNQDWDAYATTGSYRVVVFTRTKD